MISETSTQTAVPDETKSWPFVERRDGTLVPFKAERIRAAIEKAFHAEFEPSSTGPLSPSLQNQVDQLCEAVLAWLRAREVVAVEEIQDEVERTLMVNGQHGVARRYVLYRDAHAKRRETQELYCIRADGSRAPLDRQHIRKVIEEACAGLGEGVDAEPIIQQSLTALYPGMAERDVVVSAIMATRSLIEREPNYTFAAARLLLGSLYREAAGGGEAHSEAGVVYARYFRSYFERGIRARLLDPELAAYNLDCLAAAIVPERDLQFAFLGLQTLYDRYLIQENGIRIELPQLFWMRVSMGLAAREENREDRAIEFYNQLSSFRFTSATPTLFNAGTMHPQLSSCYLTTVSDDLKEIFKAIQDNALLSKWAGGLGNDWTNVRALGSHITGTNGKSQGIIPFLKVANDAALAVNQGGRRKGAVCAYLETWHLDIEEFLELRKNTGDDRRRTHDMHLANWIPDLLMKRVQDGGDWTLFSPDDVADLHDLYGKAFEDRYAEYERQADNGEIKLFRRMPAVDLWRRMVTCLFETGHPWMTWKDPSNIRSSQNHVGVVHNSNLCTEILLNTSADETAVCNLGSINLPEHIRDGRFDLEMLAATVQTAVRMLDNVIDINYYPTSEARTANMRHRPIGLGIMGFQDALYSLGISYASQEAVRFADTSMEAISYYALLASSELAAERGTYASYAGSKWSQGVLPIDTVGLLEQERGLPVLMDRSSTLDWSVVRKAIAENGMRNSNVLAIAPTATISNIVGVSQSIEPSYKNLYVKSNLSGEFTQVNTYLVDDLKTLGLWDEEMLDDLKYYDGSLQQIDRVPEDIKRRYLTAFEIAPEWLIECASRRQKWIDMGQSLNLYMAQASGKKLSEMYFLAWGKGLKTTYYLRTLAATQVEKSTIDINRRGIQPRWMRSKSASSEISVTRETGLNNAELGNAALQVCTLGEECEACQ